MKIQKIIITLFSFWINIAVAAPDIDSLSLDTSIRYGKLSNGLTYYIKQLPDNHSRITMHLYIKAGSYQQDEDQLDIAHAVEHMAFKGSKHFPTPILNNLKLFTKLGIKRQDIFAQTGLTSTQYYFRFPSKNLNALNSGLLFFHDIATDLKMDKKDIENEKGPLRQEAIYRVGSKWDNFYLEKKMESKIFPCASDFTDFFKHNRTFKPESVVEFYKDWYRPDLMAIVIVGDIDDVGDLEVLVKKEFSDIPPHTNPTKRNNCVAQYLNQAPQFVVLKKKSNKIEEYNETVELNLYFKDPGFENESNTWKGLKRKLLWPVISEMINSRLREATNVYNAYYKAYSIHPDSHFPALRVKITSENQMEQLALSETVRKIDEIRRFGFSSQEWDRAKQKRLGILERIDPDKTDYWIHQIRNHYLYGESLPNEKYLLLKNWFSKLSVEDFNLLVRHFVSNMPDDISVVAQEGSNALLFSEKEIRACISKSKMDQTSYSALKTNMELISPDELLKLKKVEFTDNGKGVMGANEILLKNGVKVILKSYKPSSGRKKERIMLHGYRTEGASNFPNEDYFNAINAPSIIKNTGVGNKNKFEINRLLAGTSFQQGIQPYVDYYESGIRGDALSKDFEKMLQLVYLYFSNPRKDSIAFHDWKKNELTSYLQPRYGLIREDFNVKIREMLGDSTRIPRGTVRMEGISETEMHRAYEIYNILFGNAKGFTFIISGNFSLDKVIPLAQKYLGNLPNTKSNSIRASKVIEGSHSNLSPFQKILSPGNYEMKSINYLMYFINEKSMIQSKTTDWKENIKINLLGAVMNIKSKELRFNNGAALYISAAGSRINKYHLWKELFVLLDCKPQEIEKSRKMVREMINEIKTGHVSNDLFKMVCDQVIYPRYSADRLSRNSLTMKRLYYHDRFKEPVLDPNRIEKFVKSLTIKDVQKAAQKYLKNENRIEFIME